MYVLYCDTWIQVNVCAAFDNIFPLSFYAIYNNIIIYTAAVRLLNANQVTDMYYNVL